MTEQFYRNIVALTQGGGTAVLEDEEHNLDAWVCTQLAARSGENILRIGSESQEQILSLAHAIGPQGYVLTIDHSYRVLSELSQRSLETRLESRIRFLYLHLDDLKGHLRGEDFARAVGGRALYHLRQPQSVFQAIRKALKPGGLFFFYGPGQKDLAELRLFHASLRNEMHERRELFFIEQIGAPCACDAFSQVEFTSFECPLRFTTPAALYTYWRESELYEETLDRDFRYAAIQYFQSHPAFETVQRLIGVKAVNG